jgi:succinate-acetate transporter protein/Trk K+ transport system NAD-binding subunit
MTGNHFIVCGDGSLAYRITSELTSRYAEDVVVVLPDPDRNYGPQITALGGVTVLSHAALTSDAFVEAGIATARGLALVGSDDLVNFHAALRADELNPGLRIVVAAFNRRLGQHIRGFFRDCTVLSSSETAAPSFVSAALGLPAPSHIRVSGRTLYVARHADVPAGHTVCGLEVPDDPAGTTQLVPPDELPPVSPDGASPAGDSPDGASAEGASSDNGRGPALVLAVADGTPRDPLTRRRHPVRASTAMLWRLAWNKFALVFAILLAAVITGFCLLLVAGYPAANAIYLTVMDMTGSALTSAKLGGPEKISQVILTVAGMALIPLVTAIIVGARLTGKIRGEPRPRGGHIIVVGLGNVGTRVVGELHDLGYDVTCVDRDPEARGVALARRLSMPIVIGEAYLEEKLRAAGLETAAALVSVTSNDMVNLETALQARALREDLRLVLRLGDDDLAQRVQKTLGNVISRSVSYMAAPAFAAALLEHQVLRTIAVGRHVLLIADVRVEDGSDIAGRALAELERDRLARVLALQVRGAQRFHWSPHDGYLLAAGDRVIVLATRAGLTRFLTGNAIIKLFGSREMGYGRVTLLAELSIWFLWARWEGNRYAPGQRRREQATVTGSGPNIGGNMSVSEDRTVAPAATAASPIADPAPLGLAAFALTTFLLSAANAHWMNGNATGDAWLGYAFAYGGLGQLLAGMWEFRNRNVFGATAFSTYGGFWIGLGIWAIKVAPSAPATTAFANHDIAWILLAFAVFNTYMLLFSAQVNTAVFAVFLTLEVTEIVLAIGNFSNSPGTVQFGGYVGLVTALCAWYTSAAGVSNGLAGRIRLPVGKPLLA